MNFRLWNTGLIGWTSRNFGALVLQAYQEQEFGCVDFRLCVIGCGLLGSPVSPTFIASAGNEMQPVADMLQPEFQILFYWPTCDGNVWFGTVEFDMTYKKQ